MVSSSLRLIKKQLPVSANVSQTAGKDVICADYDVNARLRTGKVSTVEIGEGKQDYGSIAAR